MASKDRPARRPRSPLQQARVERGWTQRHAVDRLRAICPGHPASGECRLDIAKLSDYERGARRPSVVHIEALARLYERSPEQLGLIAWRTPTPEPAQEEPAAESPAPDQPTQDNPSQDEPDQDDPTGPNPPVVAASLASISFAPGNLLAMLVIPIGPGGPTPAQSALLAPRPSQDATARARTRANTPQPAWHLPPGQQFLCRLP